MDRYTALKVSSSGMRPFCTLIVKQSCIPAHVPYALVNMFFPSSFTIMKACWLMDPLSRPTFTDIKERFEMLISRGTPYVEFEFDTSSPYYNVASFMSIGESDESSLSEDPEEDEADWEMRFRTLDRSVATSFSERYATDDDGNNWLSADFVAAGEYRSRERRPLDSASSDTSTTPLANGFLQCKENMSNTSELSKSLTLTNGPVHSQKNFHWYTDNEELCEVNGVPSTKDVDGVPFTIDHYVNFDP